MVPFLQEILDKAKAQALAEQAATQAVKPAPITGMVSPGSYNSNTVSVMTDPTPSAITPVIKMTPNPTSTVNQNPVATGPIADIVGAGSAAVPVTSYPKIPTWILIILAVLVVFLIYKFAKK